MCYTQQFCCFAVGEKWSFNPKKFPVECLELLKAESFLEAAAFAKAALAFDATVLWFLLWETENTDLPEIANADIDILLILT